MLNAPKTAELKIFYSISRKIKRKANTCCSLECQSRRKKVVKDFRYGYSISCLTHHLERTNNKLFRASTCD